MQFKKQLTGDEVTITGMRITRIQDTLQKLKIKPELSYQVSVVKHY